MADSQVCFSLPSPLQAGWMPQAYPGVHVDEAVVSSEGERGPPHHSAVVEVVVVLQASYLTHNMDPTHRSLTLSSMHTAVCVYRES